MGAPDALVAADSVPHAPGAQLESDHETPLFFGSLDTVAVKVCVWPDWIVEDDGATTTETGTAWGVDGGVAVGGGAPLGDID